MEMVQQYSFKNPHFGPLSLRRLLEMFGIFELIKTPGRVAKDLHIKVPTKILNDGPLSSVSQCLPLVMFDAGKVPDNVLAQLVSRHQPQWDRHGPLDTLGVPRPVRLTFSRCRAEPFRRFPPGILQVQGCDDGSSGLCLLRLVPFSLLLLSL